MSTGGHNRQRRSLDDPTKMALIGGMVFYNYCVYNCTIIVKYWK